MNVWIVNPYGTLPSEGWREYRSAMLARALAARGCTVRWWISDIEHRSKQRRKAGIADPLLPPEITIEVVPARAYQRNISLGRVLYERSFAAGFSRTSRTLPVPDLIVLADPSLFFAGPIAHYARRAGVPFVLDVLDLWPELFAITLPAPLRRYDTRIFGPLYRRRDRLIQQAAAVVAVTADYMAEVTRRMQPARSQIVYLGVDRSTFGPPGPDFRTGTMLNVIYAGTLGEAYDIPVVLAAIEHMAEAERPVRFTIAGDGPWQSRVRTLAAQYPRHVVFLGQVPASSLAVHYAAAHIGLASYASGSTVSMPVKFFDYMAAGLATVGSMGGEAGALLRAGAGQLYRAGSVDGLVAAIERYIEDPAALKQARQFSLHAVREFDQSVQHARFAELLETIIKTKKPYTEQVDR